MKHSLLREFDSSNQLDLDCYSRRSPNLKMMKNLLQIDSRIIFIYYSACSNNNKDCSMIRFESKL